MGSPSEPPRNQKTVPDFDAGFTQQANVNGNFAGMFNSGAAPRSRYSLTPLNSSAWPRMPSTHFPPTSVPCRLVAAASAARFPVPSSRFQYAISPLKSVAAGGVLGWLTGGSGGATGRSGGFEI